MTEQAVTIFKEPEYKSQLCINKNSPEDLTIAHTGPMPNFVVRFCCKYFLGMLWRPFEEPK
jgi:hypothetical protein|tara:strand:- start:7628 stop:7810 length:183 start_codon:yes stop_codon:yes gene_type:complete